MSDDRFKGDFSRNEVELDLEKFMDLLKENSDLKDKVRALEFEDKVNPWQRWIHLGKVLDAYRLIPRAFLSMYMVLLYNATTWFMNLDAPTAEQSALISVIVGAGAMWFSTYVGNGKDK